MDGIGYFHHKLTWPIPWRLGRIQFNWPLRNSVQTFQNESFDAVVDKGTMDALFCAGSPVSCVGDVGWDLQMLEDVGRCWTGDDSMQTWFQWCITLATHDLSFFFEMSKRTPKQMYVWNLFILFKSMFYLTRAAIVVRDVSNWKLSNRGFIPKALNRIFCHSIHHISGGFVFKTPMVSTVNTRMKTHPAGVCCNMLPGQRWLKF